MQTTVVQYKVKADRADENRAFIRDVFEELDANRPDGLRYVSFNLDDGLTFVHVAVVESEDGENPLPKTDSFKKFIADIRDRCDVPPAASSASIIGSYRLFWQKLADGDSGN